MCFQLFTLSIMDKTVLLIVLSLQTLLLISAFTSTDGAAVVTDDQQKQVLQLKEIGKKQVKPKFRFWGGCFRKTGGCSAFRVKPTPSAPTPSAPDFRQLLLKKDRA